jgi:molybdopterin synthase sulfur carrier subunit
MNVNILFFGQLTDLTGAESISMTDIIDTNSMMEALQQAYPALVNSKYLVAVNKKVISANTTLTDNCTVALLPPFSGG